MLRSREPHQRSGWIANALCACSSVASRKYWEGPNILSLSKKQHLLWDTTSRSTKRQVMQEILGRGMALWPHWLRLCVHVWDRSICGVLEPRDCLVVGFGGRSTELWSQATSDKLLTTGARIAKLN